MRGEGAGFLQFQSHAGSIEAIRIARLAGCPPPPFQSHAGSIEAGLDAAILAAIAGVSIPRWFD